MSNPRILITNAYSARNKGDAGIILGMLSDLGRNVHFRGASITIASSDWEYDQSVYEVTVVPSFQSLAETRSKSPHLRQLRFLCLLLPYSLLWLFCRRTFRLNLPLSARVNRLIQAYLQSDLIIAAGGGYLYTRTSFRGYVVLLMNLYGFLFGRLLGKPVYLYSQSIGPFQSRLQEWMVKQALKSVRLIELREDESFRLVESWNLRIPLFRSIDSAFLVPCGSGPNLNLGKGRKILVGVTARRWFPDSDNHNRYILAFARFLDWLAEEQRAGILFVPQVTFSRGGDDDREVAREIYSYCRFQESVYLIEDELEPEQVKTLCSRMDYFVGTRFHSCIYAMSANVPTIAVAYQYKTTGIMHRVGLGDYTVPIENLEVKALKSVFEKIVEHRSLLKEMLQLRIPDLRRQVYENSEPVSEDFLSSKGMN